MEIQEFKEKLIIECNKWVEKGGKIISGTYIIFLGKERYACPLGIAERSEIDFYEGKIDGTFGSFIHGFDGNEKDGEVRIPHYSQDWEELGKWFRKEYLKISEEENNRIIAKMLDEIDIEIEDSGYGKFK